MEGGAGLQGKAPPRLGCINTLANTMKHCINVSNYWWGERMGAGGGLEGWGDVIRMSHWLSITPTGVEERLPIKTAPMRWGLSAESLHCIVQRKERKRRKGRGKQGRWINQRRKICHVSLSHLLLPRPLSSSSSSARNSFAKATKMNRRQSWTTLSVNK